MMCEGCGEEKHLDKDKLCIGCRGLKATGAFDMPPLVEVKK